MFVQKGKGATVMVAITNGISESKSVGEFMRIETGEEAEINSVSNGLFMQRGKCKKRTS